MGNDVCGESGKSLPGENAKMQKIKETLRELLCVSPKGNVSRDLLLQKVSVILHMPEVIQWGPACNKAVRWEFPNKQEEFSDGENVTYQPLRDMSLDLEKLLEHLPTVVYWTGDLQSGVARDEVLDLLHEKIDEPDVVHWGVQCNRAMRLLFPDIQMKRKGKFKTYPFIGDIAWSFIPNKRGRPRKGPERDLFLSPERSSNEILAESRMQQATGSALQMARTRSWIEAVQNYHNVCPSGAGRPPREMELHAKSVLGTQMSAHYQGDNTFFTPKNNFLPEFQANTLLFPNFPSKNINLPQNSGENCDRPQESSFYSSPVVHFAAESTRNKILSPNICRDENDVKLTASIIGDRGKEYPSSPPTRRWEREYENDGDDEEDLNSEPDRTVKRIKCEKRETTPEDQSIENSSGKHVNMEEAVDVIDSKT
ncbi:hypothetical protein ScPMuIL_011570 [Solemya velum]